MDGVVLIPIDDYLNCSSMERIDEINKIRLCKY
jgi:hypothetical protein